MKYATMLVILLTAGCTNMTQTPPPDTGKIALDLWTRLTPNGEAPSMALLRATSTEDLEQVNGLGVYSKGLDAVFATAQKVVGRAKTVGLDSVVVSSTLLAPNVILAHILSSADVPQGPHAGKVQFRFTLIIVKQDVAWKVRSASTTVVQPQTS